MTMSPPPIVLPENLGLPQLAALLEEARQGLSESAIVLDASAVKTISLPGLQFILAARRELRISLHAPSQTLSQMMETLGFSLGRDEGAVLTMGTEEVLPKTKTLGSQVLRVLTVDDSRTIRDMLKLTLDAAGFDVTQAVDGEDGLGKFREGAFDLVITDINMPRMDGFQLIQAIRTDRAYDDVPILVLSTESGRENIDIARTTGASGWIVKPFDPAVLLETVKQVIS